MKKIEKTNPNNTHIATFSQKNKPSLLQLLPQILKIFPNFNLTQIFKPKQSEDVQSPPKQQNGTYKTFQDTQNIKFAQHVIENHNTKILEIKQKSKKDN